MAGSGALCAELVQFGLGSVAVCAVWAASVSRHVDFVVSEELYTVSGRERRKTVLGGKPIHAKVAAPLAADRRGCCASLPPAAPAGPHGGGTPMFWVKYCTVVNTVTRTGPGEELWQAS